MKNNAAMRRGTKRCVTHAQSLRPHSAVKSQKHLNVHGVKAASKQASTVKKQGLSGTAAPNTSQALGRVDPAAGLNGKIYMNDDDIVHDVMLNLVDVSCNMDKYYILQLVEEDASKFVVFTRWGRTGTSGSCKKETFADSGKAVAQFAKVFKRKTGAVWADSVSYRPQTGKYEWIQVDHAQTAQMWRDEAKWQYWVDDGVDGKSDGWYDYTDKGSAAVEQLFHEWSFAPHLHQRIVASGVWDYLVDLAHMTQTNVKHPNRTSRHIRRWTQAVGDDQTPPGVLAAAGTKLSTPARKRTKAAAPATPSQLTQPRKRGTSSQSAARTSATSSAQTGRVKTGNVADGVDPACTLLNAQVHDDFTVMLNQTNVGANNNKFYRIQLLTDDQDKFYVWTHWGRVGEHGRTQLQGAFQEAKAVKTFVRKFQHKTGNNWDDRANFTPESGKYDLVEVEEGGEDQAQALASSVSNKSPPKAPPPCTLDAKTKALVELIFDDDMFKDAMAAFDIDVNKMPLGNLSQAQVQKGYDVLVELRDAITNLDQAEIGRLTGRFYTVIPHTFGRHRPPLISTNEQLKAKFEMCDVLADIEKAQELLKEAEEAEAATPVARHPVDERYDSLGTELTLLNTNTQDYKAIVTYFKSTVGRSVQLKDVWEVDSAAHAQKFKPFENLSNHKLLWHGTNVAVVAAILSGGLRIMPHSGGRVGNGIYLASEQGKSAWYVSPGLQAGENIGVMFLVQAALGKAHEIQQDDSRLVAAPHGFDSVLAKGRMEPDPKQDTTLKLDGRTVTVPQGKPVPQADAVTSSFCNSEYLLYNEGQHRLRYILTFKW